MPKRILNKRYKILGHFLFWLTSISFLCFIFYLYSQEINVALVAKALITNIGFAISVYLNLYVLIPRLLKKKSYIFYVFWLVLLLTLSSAFIQFIIVYPLRHVLGMSDRFSTFSTDTHSAFFFATFFYVLVSSFLKFIKDWLSMQDLNYKLAKIEKEKLEAELKTLKGQLNPHFLFNSLNNIYSLALTKSDKVPELILKLSDLMRHIIYESRENYISLVKEIEFVDNFIALQKIRTSEKTRIVYSRMADIPSAKIAPLLFEPFIDNAFKHGLPGTENSDFIDIGFSFQENGFLIFKLRNNYEETELWNKNNSGIGIENVKQRLEHLYDRNEYSLTITKQNQVFSVLLKLKLK
ncbi:sensor histidine kinase [Prolixibacteraceae bacterium Z1-6]|uniref:Sensor histidine kinase n=1 Tax=Draconibacterium aestuarii TaxID=2998507 RepID=A0A9X3F8A5_9BACT|nr:sensor histidine kinase [Prolixibacteraceae bacterium Z1-6]